VLSRMPHAFPVAVSYTMDSCDVICQYRMLEIERDQRRTSFHGEGDQQLCATQTVEAAPMQGRPNAWF